MSHQSTILLAGGGTGGHLYPGIAVAEALRSVWPDARPLFLCTEKEIDRVILQPTGFEFIPQPIVPWKRTIGGTLRFSRSWFATQEVVKKVLKERTPLAALGLGGYAAGAAIRAAARAKVPAAILNPDVIPGKANQLLLKYVRAACCQFEGTVQHVEAKEAQKLRITGCPIRSDIGRLPPRAGAAARLGLNPARQTLVVTGASLGAQTVNDAVIEMLKSMPLPGWQVLHLSGRDHADAVRAGYSGSSAEAKVIDFTPAMADVWAVADLAISRSGASSCAELTACGIPSILFPYPFHKDMHQRANAKVLADAGAAILLDDEKDAAKNAQKLRPAVESLLHDPAQRRRMSDAARALGKPDAALNVAHVITEIAGISR